MAATLEASYRSLLRLFPREWRKLHGEALIGTLLDSAEAQQRTRVKLAERADLIQGAAQARVSSVMSDTQRAVVSSLSAAVGLAAVACSAEYDLARAAVTIHEDSALSLHAGAFLVGGFAFALVWLLMLAARLRGYRRIAVAMLVAVQLLTVVNVVGDAAHQPWTYLDPTSAVFVAALSITVMAGQPRWQLLLPVFISIGTVYALFVRHLETTAVARADEGALALFRSLHFYVWAGFLNFGNLAVLLAVAAVGALCLRLCVGRSSCVMLIAIVIPWALAWLSSGIAERQLVSQLTAIITSIVVVGLVVMSAHRRSGRDRVVPR